MGASSGGRPGLGVTFLAVAEAALFIRVELLTGRIAIEPPLLAICADNATIALVQPRVDASTTAQRVANGQIKERENSNVLYFSQI
jgi:hypothetical protein